MGTAPDSSQPDAMPDPARLARRSIGLLQRLGMSDGEARATVIYIAERVAVVCQPLSAGDAAWFLRLTVAATGGYPVHQPSITDTEVNRHGDGSGG